MARAQAYLLDTGVLVHYARASKAGQAIESRFSFMTSPFKPVICAVTLGEIRAFAQRNGWGTKKLEKLQTLLDNVVHVNIDSDEVIAKYADIHTYTKRNGIALGDNDTWIAATTKASHSTLITCDRDFDALNPTIIRRIYVDPHSGLMA